MKITNHPLYCPWRETIILYHPPEQDKPTVLLNRNGMKKFKDVHKARSYAYNRLRPPHREHLILDNSSPSLRRDKTDGTD